MTCLSAVFSYVKYKKTIMKHYEKKYNQDSNHHKTETMDLENIIKSL